MGINKYSYLCGLTRGKYHFNLVSITKMNVYVCMCKKKNSETIYVVGKTVLGSYLHWIFCFYISVLVMAHTGIVAYMII